MADSRKDRIRKAFLGYKPADSDPSASSKAAPIPEQPTGEPIKAPPDSAVEKPKRRKPSKATIEAQAPNPSALAPIPVKSSIIVETKPRSVRRSTAPSVDAYIGIDFGTRFTKVALYLPHVELREVLALGSTAERLLPSRLTVGSDNLIYPPDLSPRSAKSHIEYLKMQLAEPEGGTFGSILPTTDTGHANAIRALSAFYVAGVIRLAQQAARRKKDLGARRRVTWTVNVGVPVKHCDSTVNAIFQEMCGVAWSWKDKKAQPASLNELVKDYEASLKTLPSASDDLPIQVAPELTAALAHFGEDKNTAPGLYAFFDIGGGTLDGSAFRLQRQPDGPKFDIYAAEVNSLGTMAVARHALTCMGKKPRSARERQTMLERLEQQIILGGRTPRIVVGDLERKVQVLLHSVVSQTRRKCQTPFSDDLYGERPGLRTLANVQYPVIPLFLGGGGARSEWYQALFLRTSNDLNQHQIGVGGYSVRLLPRPPGTKDDDYPRFVIALGLTSRGLHWDRYKLPSSIPLPPPPPEWQPPTPSPVTKDMV
ncbi:hypothetical protein [Microvirga pakistanensis]|uniref:hypothetical protein n=1 Tax=Microvirga pakistanensis TaxID=1682650 RepID=UPI00106BBD55|nr:hypothetical protein [Microvirga pakistanensis]